MTYLVCFVGDTILDFEFIDVHCSIPLVLSLSDE
jgi:hypothetical protein